LALTAVQEASFSKEFCRPLYESYCFSRIPQTIKELFIGGASGLPLDVTQGKREPHEVVIFLLIDGFGWRFFEKYREEFPFLQRFFASKITSQFPSTTAAHVTCINTGLPVGQSGVYEWFYYEPHVDRMIAPLLFSFAGDKAVGSLKKAGVSPTLLYPTQTIYQDLQKEGVHSYVFQQEMIAHSPYSRVMFNGAHQRPYGTLENGLDQMAELIEGEIELPAYLYLYFGEIDSAGHRHGIHSAEFAEAVRGCFTALENKLGKLLENTQKKIACLVVADHGMIEVTPETTFYLNEQFPQIKEYLKKNRRGELLVPAGSCRDFFLHIQEERLEEAKGVLEELLEGRAEVYLTRDLISWGFFGEEAPSSRFLERVGNLVILAKGHQGIWWLDKPRFSQHFYGAHGGLTRAEMETIFLYLSTK
jgi:hypothetical protein